jgi:hypothetical protein
MSKSFKNPVLNNSMCSNNEMVQYLSSAADPVLSPVNDVNNGICNGGYNAQSCCTKRDYQVLEEQWHKEINGEFHLKSYIKSIKELTLQHIYVLGKYLSPFYDVALKEKEQGKIDEKTFYTIQKITQTNFSQGIFYKKWKRHANKCLNYMSDAVKGSLCAACDPIESRRFQRVPLKDKRGNTVYGQYAFAEDLQMFALKCNDYLYGLRTIHQLIIDIAQTWNYFNDNNKMKVAPPLYRKSRWQRFQQKLKKCGKDPKDCNTY